MITSCGHSGAGSEHTSSPTFTGGLCGFLVFAFSLSALHAAPPNVTALSPSGACRGTTATMTAVGTFDTWPVKSWCDSPSVSVIAGKDKGQFTVAVAADALPGVKGIRFYDDAGASALRPFVVGTLPEIHEVEPNDKPDPKSPVRLPAVVNGSLGKSGDVDVFAVLVKKGDTLVASLVANETLRSPLDAILQLLAPNGEVLSQNHDARGLDPEFAFTAPADGTYFVRLFAFPSTPDSSIRHFGSASSVYRLTLTTGEFVETVTPFAVERGQSATVTLRGWNLKRSTFDLGRDGDHVTGGRTAYVVREPHACYDRSEHDDSTSIVPPFTLTGRVGSPGPRSVVRVQSPAGTPLALTLDAATVGSPLTPKVIVTGAKGNVLARAEPTTPNAPVSVIVTPPSAEPFVIEVKDLYGSSDPRHFYRLRLVPVVPNLAATVAVDRFTLTVGTPLDVPITLVKTEKWDGPVVPYVEGLPPGVTAEPGPAADAKSVTLRLHATAAGFNGPVRIGVVSARPAILRRDATPPRAEFPSSPASVWLTVLPVPRKS